MVKADLFTYWVIRLNISSMSEETAMNFWGRVEQAQQLEGRSIKAICRETGISYQTIMNQKAYARLPSLDDASKLAAELAQFERECILQRQAEGIAIAKAEGKYKGRKPIEKPSQWYEVIKLWKDGEITAVVAQRKLGMTPATFYRKVKKELT